MPTRLQELVKQYPYSKYGVEGDDLLPRPRFSTRQYDALFVRVDTELPSSGRVVKEHPLRLIAEAFSAQLSPSSGSDGEVWDRLKKAADEAEAESSPDGKTALTKIFADETVNLLNRVPMDASLAGPKTNAASATPTPTRAASPVRGRSFYSTENANGNGVHATNEPSNVGADDKATLKVPTSIPLPPSPVTPDWAAFSTSGFGESPQPLAFLDKDVEKSKPVERRKSGKRRQKSATRGPKNQHVDTPASPVAARQEDAEKDLPVSRPSVVTASSIRLDEAFIDFWSDALLDPISADWPSFVICKLKPLANEEKPVPWLVIEQVYTPSPSQLAAMSEVQGKKRAASPRPSFKSGGTFGGVKKRFSLFGGRSNSTASDKTKKKKLGEKDGKVGEMGEILDEEVEKQNVKNADEEKVTAGAGVVAVTVAAEELKEPKAEPSVAPFSEATRVVDEPKPDDLPLPQKSHAVVPPDSGKSPVIESPALPEPETSGSEAITKTETPPSQVHKSATEPKGQDVAQVTEIDQVPEPSPTPTATQQKSSTQEEGVASLPPAPEAVVLAGETPGPQVALSTSEPEAIALAAEPDLGASPIVDAQPAAPEPEPVTEVPEVPTAPATIPPADETTPMVTSTVPEETIHPAEEASISAAEPQGSDAPEPHTAVAEPEVTPEQPSPEPDVAPEESKAASAEPDAAPEFTTDAVPEETSAVIAEPDAVPEEPITAPVEAQTDAVKEGVFYTP
jgi:hypothetical protein